MSADLTDNHPLFQGLGIVLWPGVIGEGPIEDMKGPQESTESGSSWDLDLVTSTQYLMISKSI